MYCAQKHAIESGIDHYVLLRNKLVMTYELVIKHFLSSESFRSFFIQTLSESPFLAYKFETPPVTVDRIVQPFEFVLIDSPWLQRDQDKLPFKQYFKGKDEQDIVTFNNLGGDAILIVPEPINKQVDYAHFAAFLRTADPPQKHCLLQTIAQVLVGKLTEQPIWLNTAGGGVDWLHVRLDFRPKYYAYQPYKFN